MRRGESTKIMIADALIQLLDKKSYQNISVNEICNSCKISKRTFYNHFRDKYDVVCFIWLQLFESSWKRADGEYCELREYFQNISSYGSVLVNFFVKTQLDEEEQNSIHDIIYASSVESILNLIKRNGYEKEITDEIEELVKFYAHGIRGLHTEILKSIKRNLDGSFKVKKAIYSSGREIELIPDGLKQYLLTKKNDT